MKQKAFINIICGLFLLTIRFADAQNAKWVTVEGGAWGANISDVQGRKQALGAARIEAIKQVVGLQIYEETFLSKTGVTSNKTIRLFDTFSRISQTYSSGKIIEEYILRQWTEVIKGIPYYKVKIKALVVVDSGEVDPSFKVKIILPKDVFYVDKTGRGEELKFKLWASQDCYFYLFNIMANDSVQVILPNKFIKNNAYKKADTIQPYEKILRNLALEVSLPDKQAQTTETLYLIGLKDKVDINTFHKETNIYSYKATIQNIQKWLVQIPRNRRTETLQTIEIISRKNH